MNLYTKTVCCLLILSLIISCSSTQKTISEESDSKEIEQDSIIKTEEIDKTSKKMIQKQKELISSLEKELKEIKTKKADLQMSR